MSHSDTAITDRITRELHLAAPPARVWAALSDHRQFGTWFRAEIPKPFVVGEVQATAVIDGSGRRWPFEMEIVALEAERRFAFRWPPHDEAMQTRPDLPWTLVEFHVSPDGSGTRLTLVESGFDALPGGVAANLLRDNSGGWDIQLANLTTHVDEV